MTAPSPAVAAPWPHRWLLTMLAPEAAGIVAAGALAGLLTRDEATSLAAAAALVAAAYVHRLVTLAYAGADQRVPPVTPGAALRHDLPRCLGSVLARSAGATVLGAVTGLPVGTAAMLGVLVGLAIGWVQLTRQVAIVVTFRDEPDVPPSFKDPGCPHSPSP